VSVGNELLNRRRAGQRSALQLLETDYVLHGQVRLDFSVECHSLSLFLVEKESGEHQVRVRKGCEPLPNRREPIDSVPKRRYGV